MDIDLQHALASMAVEVVDFCASRLSWPALSTHGSDGLEREIGIDRLRAVTDETGEVVDFRGFARFDDESAASAQATRIR